MLNAQFVPIEPLAKKATRKQSPFRSSYVKVLDTLEYELNRIHATRIVVEAGYQRHQIRNDGWPYSNARPSHPDVKVSFSSRGKAMAFPCSTYDCMEDNLYAIALTLKALRDMERYGATQENQQYRGFTALPAPELDAKSEAAKVLIKLAELNVAVIDVVQDIELQNAAYRVAAKKVHPDIVKTRTMWDELEAAITVLRGGKNADAA